MGALLSTGWGAVIAQAFPPKPQFSIEEIPDLAGRVVIVTGGNTGIGKETVKVLLQHGAKVYLAARSKDKALAAIENLRSETGNEAIFLEMDLTRLSSVKKAAEEFLSKEHELHILFNNAGVMIPPVELTTSDGYDLQFGINVVGPFYFTQLLMPALVAGSKTSPDHHARIITTSSSAAYLDTLHWDTFKDGPARRQQTTQALYAQSKLADVIVAREFAKRYADQGIIAMSVNPGNIRSDLHRNIPPFVRKLLFAVWLWPIPYGALTQLWAGTMPEALNYNGEFLIPWARPGKCRAEAYDLQIGQRLWNWLEEELDAFSRSAGSTS
ncbi:NAD(P)-binding protein [Dichomitus squalens]|uniref:NAD(P)-binding protein n=1 Tax=Dichomitus squalens TaxID=114155 RepID=A0A4Q9MUD0_9APHY|nr:NAD(P)-binding protein [Dichomitus squalens]